MSDFLVTSGDDYLTTDSQGKLICRPGIVIPPTGGDPFTFTTGATKTPTMNQINSDSVFYLWDETEGEEGPVPLGIEVYHQSPATVSESSNFEVSIPNIAAIRAQDKDLLEGSVVEVMLIYNDNSRVEKWVRLTEQTTGHFTLAVPDSLTNVINNTNHEYAIGILKTGEAYDPLVHIDVINFGYPGVMLVIGNDGEHVVYNKNELYSDQSLPDWIASVANLAAGSAAVDSTVDGKGFKDLINHGTFYVDTPYRELPVFIYHQPPTTVNETSNFEVIVPSATLLRAFDDQIQNYSMQLEVALVYMVDDQNPTYNKITLSDSGTAGHFVLSTPNSLAGLSSFSQHGYHILIRPAEASGIADNTDITGNIAVGAEGCFASPDGYGIGNIPSINPGDPTINILTNGIML